MNNIFTIQDGSIIEYTISAVIKNPYGIEVHTIDFLESIQPVSTLEEAEKNFTEYVEKIRGIK